MALQIRCVHRIYLLAVLSAVCCTVAGYGDGPTKAACKTQVPNHYGSKPQTSDSPYIIELVDLTSDGGAKVRISGTGIKGFMVHARDHNDGVVGTFTAFSPRTASMMCTKEGDTWCHTEKSPKTSLEARWVPPSDFAGPVQFIGSIVRDEKTYWVNVTTSHVVGSETVESVTYTATGDHHPEQGNTGDNTASTAGQKSRSSEL